MRTDQIMIANLKCPGCAATIVKELGQIAGVKRVDVDIEHDTVNTEPEGVERTLLINRFASLGYPEATDNGLLLQLKSYKSCVIGRIHNL